MADQDTEPSDKREPRRQHGGRREGSGRRPALPAKVKGATLYVSVTAAEKERLERASAKRGLTLSFYLREKLGLPIE